MERSEPDTVSDPSHRVELDLPPPGLGRARKLATLALHECWDVLSVANKEKRSLVPRGLKAARRQERKVVDLEKRPAPPHDSKLIASPRKLPTTSDSPLIKPTGTATGRQREGIRVVIVGHPEIVAYRYGDPDRDLIDASRILEGRRRELGID